jgi:hypothetical protein
VQYARPEIFCLSFQTSRSKLLQQLAEIPRRRFLHRASTPSLNVFNSSAVLPNGLDEMCYFDQEVFICGDWKWRSRRQGCSKVVSGDTCSMKLIMFSQYTHERCNICQIIEVKQRRISKLEDRIRRWSLEAERWMASIERTERDIHELRAQITQREMARPIRLNSLR